MRRAARLACGLLVCLALAPGCQRLNDERTVQVGAGEAYKVEFDPPRSEQQVTVTLTSPGVPISAYLVKREDSAQAMDAALGGKAPASALDGKEKGEEITLSATIPAKTGFAVVIKGGSKKAEVKIKTVGR
jgi:hypothetical protein